MPPADARCALEGQRREAESPSGPLDVFGNVGGLADSEPGRHDVGGQIPRTVASLEGGLHGLGREILNARWGKSGLPPPEGPEAQEHCQRLGSVPLRPLAAQLDAVEQRVIQPEQRRWLDDVPGAFGAPGLLEHNRSRQGAPQPRQGSQPSA